METHLLIQRVVAEKPLPKSVVDFVKDVGPNFLPKWARRLHKTCKDAYSWYEKVNQNDVVNKSSVGFGTHTGTGSVDHGEKIPDSTPDITADLNLNLAHSLASFAAQAFVQTAFSFLLSDVLGTEKEHGMEDCLRSLMVMVQGVAHQVQVMREEMHERFDAVDHKLDVIHGSLVRTEAAIVQRLESLQVACASGFRAVLADTYVITLKLTALQDLCGEMACGMTWAKMDDVMLDIDLFFPRFGFHATPDAAQLRTWLIAIEDTVLNPHARTSLRWMTRAHFLTEPHTTDIDHRYFRGISSPLEAVGWLTDGRACFLPFDVFCRTMEVYHALRQWACDIITSPPYDSAGICSRRMMAMVHDVVITSVDVAAKLQQSMVAVKTLAFQRQQLQLKWDTVQEMNDMVWKRCQETRWRELAHTITHLDTHVAGYSNVNYEEVKWYAVQLREGMQKTFLEEVSVATEPVIIVLPPKCAEDKDSILWTKKPFVLSGGNRAVVLDALAHVFDAQRFGFGTLEFVMTATQIGSASAGLWAPSMINTVPWTLKISAQWNGMQIAEFAVASPQFCADSVHGMFKTMAGIRDTSGSEDHRILWDGTVATAFVEHLLCTTTVLSVNTVDTTKIKTIRDRVHAHVQCMKTEKETALAVDVDDSSARASIRWLILLNHVPELAMDKFQTQDYQGVLNILHDVKVNPSWEWRVPYATFFKKLLVKSH